MTYTVKELPCKNGENSIFGLAYIPETGGKKVPAAILSHGYNSSHSHILDLAECLAENGIAAYCYDFCGGSSISRSDGKSTDMSVITEQRRVGGYEHRNRAGQPPSRHRYDFRA